MRTLIARDDGQLRRLESAIAALAARPPAERNRMSMLLSALESERAELLRQSPQLLRRRAAAA